MTAKILSGKELSLTIREEIKEELIRIKAENKGALTPGLAVIQVGEDPASSIYVRNKKKSCEEVGFLSFGYHLEDTVSQEELLDLIDVLNQDQKVHGILCQMPLPAHIDAFSILCAIDPKKDVDGFHPMNKGLLSVGRDALVASTPLGCIEILKRSNIDMAGKNCVVIGRSDIVGKPVAALLLQENATVTTVHSKTKNIKEICAQADILIAALGKRGFVTADFVKPGATVIDVGINRGEGKKIHGDVDFQEVSEIAGAITPVPGGVGPMTITMLLKNTLTAYKRSKGM